MINLVLSCPCFCQAAKLEMASCEAVQTQADVFPTTYQTTSIAQDNHMRMVCKSHNVNCLQDNCTDSQKLEL